MKQRFLSALSLFIFAAVLAVAAFGFSVMSEPGHMMVGCLDAVSGVGCPLLASIEHFAAHVHAFQSISIAIVLSVLSVLCSALLAVWSLQKDKDLRGHVKEQILRASSDPSFYALRLRLADWLALLEKRDPALMFAVNQ